MRLFLHHECDSPEQLDFRALLLVNDSVFLRFFTVITESKR